MSTPKAPSSKPEVKVAVVVKVGDKTMCWVLPKADFGLKSESTFDGISQRVKTTLRVSGSAQEVKNFSTDVEGF